MAINCWLASYPRSGVTMTRMLLELLPGVDTREIPGTVPDYPDTATDIMGPLFENKPCDFCFHKTHAMEPANPWPTLIVARRPTDTILSYAYYQIQRRGRPGTIEEWADNLIALEEWPAFYRHWLTTRPTAGAGPYAVVNYEILAELLQKGGATKAIGYLLNKLYLLFDEAPTAPHFPSLAPFPTFAALHEAWPKFFRSGQIGKGAVELSQNQLSRIKDTCSQVAGRLGYSPDSL